MSDTFRETMNKLLFDIFKAHELHEKSYENYEYTKTLAECFVEVCDGDETRGYTLYLMGNDGVFNDLQEMAPYYGVGYREWSMAGRVVRDIPPAPSPEYRWCAENEEWELQENKYNKDKQEVIDPNWPLI